MKYWGVAIPGLCMNAAELPRLSGLLCVNNPEVGDGDKMDRFYTLEDCAKKHLLTIQTLIKNDQLETHFTLMGMSMGGMILSILATKFRDQLPLNTQFRFFVTSPNVKELNPNSTAQLFKWIRGLPRSEKNLSPIVEQVFSHSYLKNHPDAISNYARYLSSGGNKQSLWQLIRQINAVRRFKGDPYFSKLDPKSSTFIGGKEDRLFGPKHNIALRNLIPSAIHIEVSDLGHMIHIEAPHFFGVNIN